MRYMPMAKVETGMTLGQDIYNGEGRLILGKHLILNHDNLQELLKLGFPGIYIDDEFTEEQTFKDRKSTRLNSSH